MHKIKDNFRFLVYSRALRSTAIIFMTLSFSLYLNALKVSLLDIGFVAGGTMVFALFLTLALGAIGDRRGYKYELIISELFTTAGAFMIALSPNLPVIVAGMVIAGISSGAGGMRGAFSPGSSAFIASLYPEESERVKKFSVLTRTAAVFSIIGSLMFAGVSLISKYVGPLLAYRYFFMLAAAFLVVSVLSLALLEEARRPKKTTRVMKKESAKYILRVIAGNSIGGVGVGLAIPLLPLWFKLLYNATPLEIGLIFGISYITTAFGAQASSRVAKRIGVLNTAASTRSLNGALLIAMAFSPILPIAGAIYILRAFIAGSGSPTRSTMTVKGINGEDYGIATSFQGIATRASQLSSGASGYLMDYALPLPLAIGGIFQLTSGALYKLLLKGK